MQYAVWTKGHFTIKSLPIHGVLFHITPLGNDLDAEGKWRQIDIKCLQFNDANVFSFRILFKTSKNQICL